MIPVWLGHAVWRAAMAACVACAGCAAAADGPSGGTTAGAATASGGSGTASGGAGDVTAKGGGSGTTSGGAPTNPCESGSPRQVRRLSLRELQLTLTELLGTPPETFAWSAPDPKVRGFDNNAEALIVVSGSFEDFADVAGLAVDAADVDRLAPCAAGASEEACAADFLVDFAGRAYGRAATTSERERLTALYRKTRAMSDHARGVRTGLEAILSSPFFLYRTELGASDAGTPGEGTRMTADETANALSFATTGTRPDATLRARAQEPDFLTRPVLLAEARRLLATPAAELQLSRFLRQWLGVDDLRRINKIPGLFPDYTPALKADVDREMDAFLKHVLGPGQGTLNALFSAEFSFPSELEFATLYAWDYTLRGLPPPTHATGFAPVPFAASLRRGVLSLPGWLAAHSPVHRSSPTDRGLAVRTRMFCQSLPSPPPGAVSTAPGPGDEKRTTRQKFEQHASDEKCVVCHRHMDPIGFGLEMMDALGRYRETEWGLPVDSNGMLTGTDVDGPFRGPAELADRLIESRDVRDCFALQLFRFVNGREAAERDACQMQRLREFFADGERGIADLMLEIVAQDEFTSRSYEP